MSNDIGEAAFDLHEMIRKNEKNRRILLAQNAALLSEMLEKKLYKVYLGDAEAEWGAYLGELEIFYSRNEINTYIRLYKKLTQELEVPADIWVEVPITRISDAIPVLTKENYSQWLAAAVSLTSRDWRIELARAKGKPSEDDGHHHHDSIHKICSICGRKSKVRPQEKALQAIKDVEYDPITPLEKFHAHSK